jgi:hypothetical protein
MGAESASCSVRPLLCGHGSAIHRRGFRAVCDRCGSFWDLEYSEDEFLYDEKYPEQRGHFDERVGVLKVRTLERWLRQVGVRLADKAVCEVGFGGGACLEYVATNARAAIGIEVNRATIEHLRARGVRAQMFDVNALPPRLGEAVDLWLFQDSFEHSPTPESLVSWLVANSAPGAGVLLVAPEAGSLSERILGRLWPHKLPDHRFHWSRGGLVDFFMRFGFRLEREFLPLKYVSPAMAAAHLAHKLGRPTSAWSRSVADDWAIPFNFGEMGLLLVKTSS